MSDLIRVTLPRIFWDDHYERCADHDGIRNEVKIGKRTVTVELDQDALDDLLSDADYYSDTVGWDEIEYMRPIIRSAQATLRALKKAGLK